MKPNFTVTTTLVTIDYDDLEYGGIKKEFVTPTFYAMLIDQMRAFYADDFYDTMRNCAEITAAKLGIKADVLRNIDLDEYDHEET